MSRPISESVNLSRSNDVKTTLDNHLTSLKSQGYDVEFGEIGKRTTWAMIHRGDEEIIGYTYIKGELSKKDETIGKYRALLQALARKNSKEYVGECNE